MASMGAAELQARPISLGRFRVVKCSSKRAVSSWRAMSSRDPLRYDPTEHRIAVDLDGVLADFDARVQEQLGYTFADLTTRDAKAEGWARLSKVSHFYRDLALMPDALELWDAVLARCPNPYILTAIPRRTTMATAESDKRLWVRRHLGARWSFESGPSPTTSGGMRGRVRC